MSNIDWQGSSVHPKPLENSNQQKPHHWVRKGCDQNTHWSLQLKMSPITSLFITQEMAHMVAPNFLEVESTNLLCPWNTEEISLVSQNNSITGRNDPFLGRFDSLPFFPPWVGSLFKKKKKTIILFSSLPIIFLNRKSYKKLGRGVILSLQTDIFAEDLWIITMIQKFLGLLLNPLQRAKDSTRKNFVYNKLVIPHWLWQCSGYDYVYDRIFLAQTPDTLKSLGCLQTGGTSAVICRAGTRMGKASLAVRLWHQQLLTWATLPHFES